MLPGLFAATLFVGATLLFLIEPHIGKRLLPLVGGTPGVWNACLVFFQAALLAGYFYAHRSIVGLGVRKQAVLHLAMLLVVLLAFRIAVTQTGSPIPIVGTFVPADQDYPIFGVVELLAVAVGVPFFVLSTTAPLLQRWFASTGHPAAKDPYFLYAASNAGSLLGLLAYPFLIEPRLTLDEQQWLWAGGVGVYLALVLCCAVVVLKQPSGERQPPVDAASNEDETRGADALRSAEPIPTRRILRWVGLAALPSSLLLGSTAHVSTDLAPVPLLWVVPLALYLISFILVFARWPDSVHRLVGRITPMLLVFVVLSLLTMAAEPLGLIAGLQFAALFGVCLVCHGELAKDRPHPEQLTSFYMWMSVGGVIGGLFNALLAPILFHRVGMVEYPLALALAALVRPRSANNGSPFGLLDAALLLGLLTLSVALVKQVPQWVGMPADEGSPDALVARLIRGGLMFGIPAAFAFALVRKPARFAFALASLLAVGSLDTGQLGETLHMERNFFGVVRVTRSPDGRFLRLVHGTTIHGQQRLDQTGPPRPMTYYHEKGPVGSLFRSLPQERVKKVAVVGLGTGAVAHYAKPHQQWTFFEIDPAVARVAQEYFDFLSTCQSQSCSVVLGDARRKLMLSPDGEFDVIMLDAFSSDAIPVHLLTREAMQLYMQKLAPGGVLAMHVSNNHLDLPPLVDRLAADHSPPLVARYCNDGATDAEKDDGKLPSQWMVLARSVSDLGSVSRSPVWQPVRIERNGPIWRDDFANLLWAWKRKEE
ncbi:MAG: fused MFS/spermidine synthase [Gemmataceae bacterium]